MNIIGRTFLHRTFPIYRNLFSYCLRETAPSLFEPSEPVGQLKSLLNKNTSTIHHRSLPGRTVGSQNIFFCRYVYDYRANRILKNPSINHFNSYSKIPTTSSTVTSSA